MSDEQQQEEAGKRGRKKKSTSATFRIGNLELVCPECGATCYDEPDGIVCYGASCPLKGVRFEWPAVTLERKAV